MLSTYHHLVNSVYNVEHLVFGDVAVVVNIIKTESP